MFKLYVAEIERFRDESDRLLHPVDRVRSLSWLRAEVVNPDNISEEAEYWLMYGPISRAERHIKAESTSVVFRDADHAYIYARWQNETVAVENKQHYSLKQLRDSLFAKMTTVMEEWAKTSVVPRPLNKGRRVLSVHEIPMQGDTQAI